MKEEEKATLYISQYPDGTIGFSEVAEGEYIVENREITLEYANQQPEVDYQKMFANCSLPKEKQPEQGEVDALAEKLHDEYERLSYIEGWSTQKDCQVKFENLPDANQRVMRRMAEFVLSTNQDKVRELLLHYTKWYDEELPQDDIVEMHVTNYLNSKSTKPKK
jgi:hypothetical protein